MQQFGTVSREGNPWCASSSGFVGQAESLGTVARRRKWTLSIHKPNQIVGLVGVANLRGGGLSVCSRLWYNGSCIEGCVDSVLRETDMTLKFKGFDYNYFLILSELNRSVHRPRPRSLLRQVSQSLIAQRCV